MVVDKRKGSKFSILSGTPKQKQSKSTNQKPFSRNLLTCLQVTCTWTANNDNRAVASCLCPDPNGLVIVTFDFSEMENSSAEMEQESLEMFSSADVDDCVPKILVTFLMMLVTYLSHVMMCLVAGLSNLMTVVIQKIYHLL